MCNAIEPGAERRGGEDDDDDDDDDDADDDDDDGDDNDGDGAGDDDTNVEDSDDGDDDALVFGAGAAFFMSTAKGRGRKSSVVLRIKGMCGNTFSASRSGGKSRTTPSS
jgi:hypothetical protein